MGYECTLSKELQEQAKKELGEDPERRKQDIEHIRKWIKKQPHLDIRTDDWFILRFLRGCKFSLERTKEKIDMHYTIKGMLPEWFKDRDPQDPRMKEILELGILLPLKGLDNKGRTVMLVRQGLIDPTLYSVDETTKALYMLIDVFYEVNELHSIAGFVNIVDLKGISPSLMLYYPPTVMKKSMVLWQDGYPLRFKGLHYTNAPAAFDNMYNVFKVFMKEKIRKRVTIHRENLDKLYAEVPKTILPKEYGGEGETVKELTDYWVEIVNSKRKWILEDQKNKVIESKRPGKPKNTEDLFGLDGSFRKLNVD